MPTTLANLINTAFLEERTLDANSFANSYRNNKAFDKLLFNKGPFNNFDSQKWQFFDKLTQANVNLDFNIYSELMTKNIICTEDYLLIKCYLASRICDNQDARTVSTELNTIYTVIKSTNNFDIKLKEDMNKCLEKATEYRVLSKYIIGYLSYLDSIGACDTGHIEAYKYFSKLSDNKESKKIRKLPSYKDILAFDYYLNKFFNEETNKTLRLLFEPVRLWWKITNVIPMRASEFAVKLKPDCIQKKDNKFYLHIDRIKVTTPKNKRRHYYTIPLLRDIEITDDIYNLIDSYRDSVSSDSDRLTLLSYKKYKEALDDYRSSKKLAKSPNSTGKYKVYDNEFNREVLQRCVDLFYSEIIYGRYKYTTQHTLTIGDTRHFAFCSLLLQGVSPLEIAMLGGHTSLTTQDSYTNHAEYIISSEMVTYLTKKNVKPEIDDKNLKSIIFRKSKTCPKDILLCYPTEDKIGYCTADFTQDVCENRKRPCLFCNKWWCYPSNHNYIAAQEYVTKIKMESLREKLLNEEAFLSNLLEKARIVNIADLIELDKEYSAEITSQVSQIKSTADEILFLQKALVDFDSKNLAESEFKKRFDK